MVYLEGDQDENLTTKRIHLVVGELASALCEYRVEAHGGGERISRV